MSKIFQRELQQQRRCHPSCSSCLSCKKCFFFLLLLLCVVTGCEPVQPAPKHPWMTFNGRDATVAEPIYRARVPPNWQRSPPEAPLEETTTPLCRFTLQDADGLIAITLHNFPTETIDQRIHPKLQVARWQRQIGEEGAVHPAAHGGFLGLFFDADGMLAWSMQLAPAHYRTLSRPPDSHLKRQKRADYTIKATGSEQVLARHRSAILAFAESFELIEELPLSSEWGR